ncbi:hypothetical protein J7F01_18925 [Streptomyces sp. ISL-22]|uniref:hypothetical protein n=1 Tax=unclassified Streptomyces TaxID=2593676 RepID=UPI001BEB495C|nr:MULTISPECIES: hypothetical protein [unclassified Streptomyces]MBT2416412.1 hypothetical protein [Streptomyces sp. ISL-24]MBT2434211.1 hypothetical protein [Streptomyces sp. ISL-22]
MTAFLAVVAVVAFMATAGLPWWVVAAVALLTAGFAAGRSWSPGKGSRNATPSGPAREPAWFAADGDSAARPVSAHVRVTCPEEYTPDKTPAGQSPMVRNG